MVGHLLACGWLVGGSAVAGSEFGSRSGLAVHRSSGLAAGGTFAPCLKETVEKPALLLGLN